LIIERGTRDETTAAYRAAGVSVTVA